MGNLCSSERDPFSQPGRPLGAAPTTPTTASVPASAAGNTPKSPARKVGGPPRTLGGAGAGGQASSSSASGAGGAGGDDARARAAAAAEARAAQSKKGGKLAAQLNERRGMTDAQALQQASETERRQRDVDASASALQHS